MSSEATPVLMRSQQAAAGLPPPPPPPLTKKPPLTRSTASIPTSDHEGQQHMFTVPSSPTPPANIVQVQNYTTWINNHLRKRPGVRLVDDLSSDMCDGVLLIHLIEVISGHVIGDVYLHPRNANECFENVEKVLQFVHNNSIKMHPMTSKEILSGNQRSIMRLVLALAAHFKPNNIQHYSVRNGQQRPSSTQSGYESPSVSNNAMLVRNPLDNETNNNGPGHILRPVQNRNVESMTHIMQAASVDLADVRRYRNENFNVKYVKRNNLVSSSSDATPTAPRSLTHTPLPPASPSSRDGDSSVLSTPVRPFALQQQLASPTSTSSLVSSDSLDRRHKSEPFDDDSEPFTRQNVLSSTYKDISSSLNDSGIRSTHHVDTQQQPDESEHRQWLFEEHEQMLRDVIDVKSILKQFQALLMNEEQLQEQNESINEVTVLRNQVQQLEAQCSELKHELSLARGVDRSTNDALQVELRDAQVARQQLEHENERLTRVTSEHVAVIAAARRECADKAELLAQLSAEVSAFATEREQVKAMKQQLSETLDVVKGKESALADMVTKTNRNLGIMHTLIEQPTSNLLSSDEVTVLRDNVNKLRSRLKTSQASQLLLNSIEQTVQTMCDRARNNTAPPLNALPPLMPPPASFSSTSPSNSNSSSFASSSANSPVLNSGNNLAPHHSHPSIHSPTLSSCSSSATSTAPPQDRTTPRDRVIPADMRRHHSPSSPPPVVHQHRQQATSSQKKQPSRDKSLDGLVTTSTHHNEGNIKKIISRLFSSSGSSVSQQATLTRTTPKQRATSVAANTNRNAINTIINRNESLLTISSSPNKSSPSTVANQQGPSLTKCVYFTEKSGATPFMTKIHKHVDAITLRDFKESLGLKSNVVYRFHFKTNHPEIGAVKEEISEDSALLPCYEGNIVAWIREQNSSTTMV